MKIQDLNKRFDKFWKYEFRKSEKSLFGMLKIVEEEELGHLYDINRLQDAFCKKLPNMIKSETKKCKTKYELKQNVAKEFIEKYLHGKHFEREKIFCDIKNKLITKTEIGLIEIILEMNDIGFIFKSSKNNLQPKIVKQKINE